MRDWKRLNDYEDYMHARLLEDEERKELEEDVNQYIQLMVRKISFIDDYIERQQVGERLKNKRKPKKDSFVKKNFSGSSYFQRLFPSIKQQKPGEDLYASITFVQFVICGYLITYYTSLDANGTQNLENTSLFSIFMVIMLFI